jgi:hypothetical protein
MPRRLPLGLAVLAAACLTVLPVWAQFAPMDIINTRFELSTPIWTSGHWVMFGVEEEKQDANGDGDAQDTILCLGDLRSLTVLPLGIAVDYDLTDEDDDWPVALSPEWIAIQVSEAENGGQDLNGNGMPADDVMFLYNPATKQKTNLGVVGGAPLWDGGKLYFQQVESAQKQDFNGDGDQRDLVLAYHDPATKQTVNLGMECGMGFRVAGDWIATMTSEQAVNRDLNLDKDATDTVVQLYQISAKRWLNTGLTTAAEVEVQVQLTSKLCAVGVEEAFMGNRDLNGDNDQKDCVLHVLTLPTDATAAPTIFNTRMDASAGFVAEGNFVGFVTGEADQGNTDLNGDKDTKDDVVQVYVVGQAAVVNTKLEGIQGIIAGGGKIAIPCSEQDQGNVDLNGDKDTEDYVLFLYDVARNALTNTKCTVEDTLTGSEGVLGWTVLEEDQGNRDLNRDGDTDDSIAAVMDMKTGQYTITGYAIYESIAVGSRGGAFGVDEEDQGGKDLKGDRDTDDEVVFLARLKR